MAENFEKMNESFIFYRSFYEAICDLDDKKRLKMYDAIAKLALENEEIELKKEEKRLFCLIKPQILANLKRYKDGTKGGRPKKKKEENKKTTGFENLETTGSEIEKPNYNKNYNLNKNKNYNLNKNKNYNLNYNTEVLENTNKENQNLDDSDESTIYPPVEKLKKNPDIYTNQALNDFKSCYQHYFDKKAYMTDEQEKKYIEFVGKYPELKEVDTLNIIMRRFLNAKYQCKNGEYKPANFRWLIDYNGILECLSGECKSEEESKPCVVMI